jgi:flagella basal body P-ring formation protein FlgA
MFNKCIVTRLSAMLLLCIVNLSARADTSADQIVAQVRQAALEQLQRQAESNGEAEPKFDVTVVRSSRPLGSCPVPTGVDGLDTRLPSRMRFVAICPGTGGWRYEFVVRAQVTAKVVVSAVDLPAGRVMAADDVLLERHDISAIPDSLADLQQAIGMSGKRALRSGEVLRQAMLMEPKLIKRGQEVRIVARREQVEVSMNGEALDDGARGAIVRVRNSNGIVIRARVTGAATVEPADMAASTHSPD